MDNPIQESTTKICNICSNPLGNCTDTMCLIHESRTFLLSVIDFDLPKGNIITEENPYGARMAICDSFSSEEDVSSSESSGKENFYHMFYDGRNLNHNIYIMKKLGYNSADEIEKIPDGDIIRITHYFMVAAYIYDGYFGTDIFDEDIRKSVDCYTVLGETTGCCNSPNCSKKYKVFAAYDAVVIRNEILKDMPTISSWCTDIPYRSSYKVIKLTDDIQYEMDLYIELSHGGIRVR